MQTGEVARSQRAFDSRDNAFWGSKTTGADIAAGKTTFFRLDHNDAAPDETIDVVSDSGVLPHLGVHRGAHDDRRARRQQHVGQQISAQAAGVCAEQTCRSRYHHDQVGTLTQPRVRNRRSSIPQAGLHCLAAKRRQRGPADEVFCIGSHHRDDMCAGIDQSTTDFYGLVRSNTAGDTDDDGLAAQ